MLPILVMEIDWLGLESQRSRSVPVTVLAMATGAALLIKRRRRLRRIVRARAEKRRHPGIAARRFGWRWRRRAGHLAVNPAPRALSAAAVCTRALRSSRSGGESAQGHSDQ